MPKTLIHTITDFNNGMTENIYGDGISRIEHFDTIAEVAYPFKALAASDMTHGDAGVIKDICKFTRGTGGLIYALGNNDQANKRPTIAKWDYDNDYWNNFQSFNKDSAYAEIIHFYDGALYGLWRDGNSGTTGYMWKMTTAGSLTAQHQGCNYTNYCDPITHLKDGLSYWGVDNVVYRFNGTTLSTGLTLPSNFIITSLSENGDYLSICGYNSQTYQAMEYLWDRDSSLETVTQNYDLGFEIPCHNATLGGTHFVITSNRPGLNVPTGTTAQSDTMSIRYVQGDKSKVLKSFVFDELFLYRSTAPFSSQRVIENDYMYFNAEVKFIGDSDYHQLTFCVEANGELTIAQNIAIDTTATETVLPGLFKELGAFWIGGRADGSWNTTTTYPATSAQSAFFETVKYRSPDFTKDIKLQGVSVKHEALPSGATVTIKTRADAETSWTTIGTSSTDNAIEASFNGTGITVAKDRQYRVESLGGAVITGFQTQHEEVSNKPYGN